MFVRSERFQAAVFGGAHDNTDGIPPSKLTAPVSLGALSCERIIGRDFLPHELPSLIKVIFTSEEEIKVIDSLCGSDAQTFVDVIHNVRPLFFCSRDTS